MTRKAPAEFKVVEGEELLPPPALTESAELGSFALAFEQATGWRLQYAAEPSDAGETWSATVHDGSGEPAGRLRLSPALPPEEDAAYPNRSTLPRPLVELEQARPLALALAGLLTEQNRLRHALWQREAELAAGVPIAARPGNEKHLADRLAAVLKGGADATGCQAAALYLLDETTTSLKLRATYNLPSERLLDPARALRGSLADLESLVGHAVVLEDTSLLPHWRCPEEFPAAVCVPVSGSSVPLGTLWFFSSEHRDFTSEETNLAEIIAGRLASDLEREMLLTTSTQARQWEMHLDAAARWQSTRLPSVTPLLDDFELAGWTQQAEGIGGDFHDWSVLPDGRLAIALADAQGKHVEAGLNAAAMQAALKAHSGYAHAAPELLARVNDTLWTTSAGDQYASLFYGLIEPDSGTLEFALAGTACGILVSRGGPEILSGKSAALGTGPDACYESSVRRLAPGAFLILLSEGARNVIDEAGLKIGEPAIASLVAKHRHDSAEAMLVRIRRLLDRGQGSAEDLTVLVVKRRG